jgi:hypothetical protein
MKPGGTESMRFPIGKRALLAVMFAALAVASVLGACSKQPTSIDPSFTMPEGTASARAQLVLWYDLPNHVDVYLDKPPSGPSADFCNRPVPGDSDVVQPGQAYDIQRAAPGTIFGLIFDGTPGNAYQVFRRESGGGFHQLDDFNLKPTTPWIDRQWEIYSFSDPHPSVVEDHGPSYVGRGVIQGSVTESSPLTNVAQLPVPGSGPPIADITLHLACKDSCFNISWDPVPGAARYWIQVYQFKTRPNNLEAVLAGAPTPLYTGLARDFFVGYLEGNQTAIQIGDTTRTDVTILTLRNPIPRHQVYKVRVAAVDDQGNLLAVTQGTRGSILIAATLYGLFRQGAYDFEFTPKTVGACPRFP